MKKLATAAFIAMVSLAQAQKDTIKTPESPLKISGYAEIYYLYDFGAPENNTRPGFVYSHNRHNEVSLNLGFVKANYEKETSGLTWQSWQELMAMPILLPKKAL